MISNVPNNYSMGAVLSNASLVPTVHRRKIYKWIGFFSSWSKVSHMSLNFSKAATTWLVPRTRVYRCVSLRDRTTVAQPSSPREKTWKKVGYCKIIFRICFRNEINSVISIKPCILKRCRASNSSAYEIFLHTKINTSIYSLHFSTSIL